MFPKHKRVKSDKLRESAKGQDCFIRLPDTCNYDRETTVLAHLNGAGMGYKEDDYLGSFACSACHAEVDEPKKSKFDGEYLKNAHYDGMKRTQKYWVAQGLMVIK